MKVVGARHNSRPEIIGTLLKDRHVPRFLVAPTGFGKSTIAFEYAEIIFAFKHVFWIRCDSPCFIRDLDSKKMFAEIVDADEDVKLVVCDDMPVLNHERTELFDKFLDDLLEAGCEVIVCSTPASDIHGRSIRECICVRGVDLLLSDDELSIEELRGAISKGQLTKLKDSGRIPCSRWSADGNEMILKGLKSEEVPDEIKLAMLLMLLVKEGGYDILDHFIKPESQEEVMSFIYENYPLFGMDPIGKTFCSLSVGVKDIKKMFDPDLDRLATASIYEDKDQLCSSIADHMIEIHETDLAAEFLESFSSKANSASWLVTNGWHMLSIGRPTLFIKLHEQTKKSAVGYSESLSVQRAWAEYMLDYPESALKISNRIIRSSATKQHDRFMCAVLLSLIDAASDAWSLLTTSKKKSKHGIGDGVDAIHPRTSIIDWKLLSQLAYSASSDPDSYRSSWLQAYSRIDGETISLQCRRALVFGSYWILESIGDKYRSDARTDIDDHDVEDGRTIGDLEESETVIKGIKEQLEILLDIQPFDWFAYKIAKMLDRLSGQDQENAYLIPDPVLSSYVRKGDALLTEQSEAYRRFNADALEKRVDFQKANPDVFRRKEENPDNKVIAKTVAPVLNVSLFGGLDVKIGDDLIDPKLISRKKTKTLLALLTTSKGKELSRDHLAESLWPESSLDAYKRNFYGIWAQLKKALSVDGKCPYLIRTQSGCKIDPRYLRSDLDEFESLCKKLLLGTDDPVSWEMLYSEVADRFRDDLLPAETENSRLIHLRQQYRESLIDGLVATSARLKEAGEVRGALWFAREALRRNDKREDAYIVLMEAQIASNQRSDAIETYFACRRFLSEELGIDPSLRLIELYRSIIESEEIFV